MPSKPITPSEGGFSLIELLIAIVVTLIVTGSVFGLLSQGQNAFRREPEISDRQQQIRLAMDLIQRDIATAGMAMPEWTQAFTPGLDGAGPDNAQGVPSDYLEMMGYDGACLPVPLCVIPGGAGTIQTSELLPACYHLPATPVFVITRPGVPGIPPPNASTASLGVATGAAPGGGCPAGEVVAIGPPGRPPTWDIQGSGAVLGAPGVGDVRPVQIVLYRIYVDPGAGIPNLWRSAQGGLDATLAPKNPGDAGADWQLVASGIEDLQVQYRDGNGGWVDPAPTVNPALPPPFNWASIVREVKVTLTSRTTGQQLLQGESVSVTGQRAIRGSLTSVTVPRAALAALSWVNVPAGQQWN